MIFLALIPDLWRNSNCVSEKGRFCNLPNQHPKILSTDNPFDVLLWTANSSHSDEEVALSRSFEEAHRFPIPEFEAAGFVEVSSAAVGVLGRNLWSNGILQAHHQAGSAVFLRCSHGKIFVEFSLLDSEGIHIPDRHVIVSRGVANWNSRYID
jgi:hypothetical protein